jgi:hypothetical protein
VQVVTVTGDKYLMKYQADSAAVIAAIEPHGAQSP